MLNIYFISGLGADERVFQNLILPAHWKIHHIHWIPNAREETLSAYARRLSVQIDSSQPFSLVGLSFGGIMAIELAKFIYPEKIILLSSIASRKEMPMNFLGDLLWRKLKLHRLVPGFLFKQTNTLSYWFFGTKTMEEKQLLKQIIDDTDPHFAKWALDHILNWDNNQRPTNLYQVHGTEDKLFPVKKTMADAIIPGGGHFMVFNKAAEISKLLVDQLDRQP